MSRRPGPIAWPQLGLGLNRPLYTSPGAPRFRGIRRGPGTWPRGRLLLQCQRKPSHLGTPLPQNATPTTWCRVCGAAGCGNCPQRTRRGSVAFDGRERGLGVRLRTSRALTALSAAIRPNQPTPAAAPGARRLRRYRRPAIATGVPWDALRADRLSAAALPAANRQGLDAFPGESLRPADLERGGSSRGPH